MPDAPTFTAEELEIILEGRADGLRTRLIALLLLRNAIDIRTALRRYPVSISRVYAAKIAIEAELNSKRAFEEKAREIRGESPRRNDSTGYAGNALPEFQPSSKMFL